MSGRGRCGGSAFDGAPPLAQAHSRSRRGQHACAAGSGSQRGSARHPPPRTVDCPCLRRLPPAPHPPQPGPPPGASQEVLRRGGASLPCEVEDLLPRGWRGGLSGRAKGLQEKEPKAASLGGPFGYSQGLLRTNNCLPSKRSSFQRLICAEVATKVPGVFLTTVALRAGECEAARLWQPRGKDMEEASLPWPAERLNAPGISRRISVSEFSCHCCYDILINPTTLNCGHSFCRHCLALWWMSSKRNECPECREKWEGFPKVNILLRNAVEKLFPVAIEQRKDDILQNHEATQSLAAFQKYGSDQPTAALNAGRVNPPGGGFFSGVLTALTCVAVVLLGYHWSSRESEDGLLVHKPVAKWTTEEVAHWLGQLGPWTSLYRERFLQERVNGRLLLTLTDEELRQAPYQVENSSHRKAIAMELERVKLLGVKPPQNLWEYKAVQPGRSLFLLYALKSSPRLTMLYLYLSDYSDTFLPFIHTVCPVSEAQELEDVIAKLHDHKDPVWKQWREFLVKFAFLPYQLLAEFAWDWLETHYWTSRFIIVNAMLLSVLELFSFWRLWSRRELKRIPYRMWSHFWKMSTQGFLMAIFWPVIPQFACNCLFYWALYFNPIINIDLVVKEVRRLETQVL